MGIYSLLSESKCYNNVLNYVADNYKSIMVYGVGESQKAFLAAGIKRRHARPMLVITSNSLSAKMFKNDLSFFLSSEKILYFPSGEILPYEVAAYSPELLAQRLTVLDSLSRGECPVVVCSIDAMFMKLIPPEVFKRCILSIQVGMSIELNELEKNLVYMGYERVNTVEGKGQFGVRGGIIDVYPYTADNPYRIELFGDEVDSIRVFDVMDQRSIDKIEEMKIPPANELVLNDEVRNEGRLKILEELEKRCESFEGVGKIKEAQNLRDKITKQLAQLEETLYFEGMELYISYFYHKLSTILDYFYESPLVILDEPRKIAESAESFLTENHETYKTLLSKGEILASQSNIYYSFNELMDILSSHQHLQFALLPQSSELFEPDRIVSVSAKTMHAFHGKLDLLLEEVKSLKQNGYCIIILSGTTERGERLKESLEERQLEVLLKEDVTKEVIKRGQVIITPGTIEKGFEFSDIKLAVISDKEAFGKAKRKRITRKQTTRNVMAAFADLNEGDYVVHASYGIGKYVGIQRLKVENTYKDYVCIKYAGDDKLYIPTDQMHLIQKYIGLEGKAPKLSKLGSSEWSRIKSRVKASIKEMADELLKLYAARGAIEGHAFSPDTPWQKEFEDLFPYEETPDQLQAIAQVKADMEKPKPMDRLLCGDVGYGKTEVALRAAFKAVMDGKQVGVLVPTTILAQQHYTTFTDRFSPFPVRIEVISRFKSPKEQRQILQDLKQGRVDIIIGTHRLLQKDIKFKDLGLLIVDEEQRFGVAHKEKLKQMKKSVDVLTLTATPIPRTLHMSLSGVRDMSIIETPPEDRYPVQTYVVEYNEGLIRDAILREIGRNGQVYYVFNRVEYIDKEASRLAQLVPEARIGVAHGQMPEHQLEQVMMQFLNGDFDVLVCTTIIESGLDIPNVNTLIVIDADKMGLAQLYQLRGRVGRSNRQAYAYITYRRNKILSEVAEKRLQAIKEFTEFGSGFKIAMRDLEIRGAGNLLGPQQHGHMVSVGYELYCKLLDQTVKELKGEKIKEEVDPTVDLKVDAYIDETYIRGSEERIDFYKRIAAAESTEEINDLEEEIEDRYGEMPEATRNLFGIARIKVVAKSLKIASIIKHQNRIEFTVQQGDFNLEQFKPLVDLYRRRITFYSSGAPRFALTEKKRTGYKLIIQVLKILETLKGFKASQGVV